MNLPEFFSRLVPLEISAGCWRVLFWFLAGNKTLRGSPFNETLCRRATDTLIKNDLIRQAGDEYVVLLPGLAPESPIEPPPSISPSVLPTPAPAVAAPMATAAPAPVQRPQYVFHDQKAYKFMTRPRPQQEQALASWAITGANLDDHSTAAQAAAALMAQQAPPPDCEPALAMAEDFAQVLFPV